MTTGFSFNPLWFRLEAARKWLIDELEQLRTVGERRGNSPWAKEDEQYFRVPHSGCLLCY